MNAEALDLFAQRDRLEGELAVVNDRLAKLKSQYMEKTRLFGIRDERFRHEISRENA
jgi:hypothetical protein